MWPSRDAAAVIQGPPEKKTARRKLFTTIVFTANAQPVQHKADSIYLEKMKLYFSVVFMRFLLNIPDFSFVSQADQKQKGKRVTLFW